MVCNTGLSKISIHAPPRGATVCNYLGRGLVHISIHAPPRGATTDTTRRNHFGGFQFTPLREGRHDKKRRDAVVLIFQFTPLREGRHFAEMVQKPFCYFNSRPSARGDGSAMTRIGAGLWDFNSRPSARGDARESSALRRTKHFNSRPSARGDLSVTSGVGIPPFISIHAPPRGATNPPPPRAAVPLFQFTPLREGRPSAPAARLSAGDFNSRPSARGDRPR